MIRLTLVFFLFTFHQLAGQSWIPLTYNENQPNLELNPLKGFANMWPPSNNFPRSIQGKLFGLDDIMFGLDSFNWAVVDTFLSQEAYKGNHSYIQVNIDPAFGNTDMPSYLLPLVETYYYDDLDTNGVDDLCPNWNDSDLMNAMLNFIDKFGERYDGDSRIFMVHLGLYGMWGEWHIGEVEDIKPHFALTDENKNLIANAYKSAFPNTLLLARYPQNMPQPQDYGYSDGLFFTQSISNTQQYYFHNILKNNHASQNWERLPIGGEIDPAVQDTIWEYWPNNIGQDVSQCFDSIHPTWLFSNHVFTALNPGTIEWSNAIKAHKLMGYQFYLNKYKLSAQNGKPRVEINIENRGIAPLYANWQVEFGAINSTNSFKSLGSSALHLFLVQPDVINNYRSFFSDTVLANGSYKIVMRIKNPLSVYSNIAKPIRFANETQDNDIDGWLTLGNMTITGGNSGVVPVKVTGVTLSHDSVVMLRNNIFQLTANVSPGNATHSKITWISDRPGIASADSNGLVTSKSIYGVATITAYTQDGGYLDKCIFSVVPVMIPIPDTIQAENFTDMFGVVVQPLSAGNFNLGYIDQNDWMEYGITVSTTSIFIIDYRVSSASGGGKISFVNQRNKVLDIVDVDATGWWGNYITESSKPILLEAGSHIIRLVATQGGFNIDWLEFKSGPPLLPSYTFNGSTNNQFYLESNWISGNYPPNGYNGIVNINADCVRPKSSPFVLSNSGQCILGPNVDFQIK